MKNLVSVEWLNENIDDTRLVIVDCRFNLMDKEYSEKSYKMGHIKGALRIDIETQLSSEVKEHGGRHPLPSIEELKNTFESIGIRDDSIVICYDEFDLAGASRLWWILKYLGHENSYVLEGGIEKFKELGKNITTEIKEVKEGNLTINVNEDMIVDMNYVKQRLHNTNVAIIDSRENIRYRGEFEPVDKKAGHIPSAMNYFWIDIFNKEDNNISLKSAGELKIHFKNLNKYNEVIVYCGSGITACPNSLALSEANIKHKVYTGSFSDWISYDDNEIETITK